MKYVQEKEGRHTKWALLLSLFALIIGCIGYFSIPRGHPIFYISAHMGALGLLGVIGWSSGLLAKKKGRNFSTAFFLGSLLPIAAGIIAVAIFLIIQGRLYCGGSVSLAAALLVVLVYALISRKTLPRAG